MTPIENRLAVCSWSLQAANPRELAAKLGSTGISRVQLALDPLRENPAVWRDAEAVLKQAGITIISGMFGCVGEDYSTLDTIRATGGINRRARHRAWLEARHLPRRLRAA